MISPDRLEEIRRLMKGGELSQRAIARRTGVSRGTVRAVAQGIHRRGSGRSSAEPSGRFTPPGGLPLRCPACGAKVQMPCLACYLRGVRRRLRNVASPGRPRERNPKPDHQMFPGSS